VRRANAGGLGARPVQYSKFLQLCHYLSNLLGAIIFRVGLGISRTLGAELVRGAVTLYLVVVFIGYALLLSHIPTVVLHQILLPLVSSFLISPGLSLLF
jgi:hypothetical protein